MLILSDIHYGKSADFPPFKSVGSLPTSVTAGVPMGKDLIRIVKKLTPKPDAILVLGDLTSIGSPSEFDGCVNILREIASSIGVNKDMVFFTFGNHDVDWRICSLGNATEHFDKDFLYNQIAASVGAQYALNPPNLKSGPIPGSGVYETEDFVLFIVNSGYFCITNQSVPHGKLGDEQIEWLRDAFARHNADDRWRILMLHHHPFNYKYPTLSHDISTLEEGPELLELIGEHSVDFICHGHRHHPKHKTQLENKWKRPATFFCAGSLAVHAGERCHGTIPNLFHIVDLESRLSSGGAFGRVHTYEYSMADGWRAIKNTSETPLDHIQHFGAVTPQKELEEMIKVFLLNAAKNLVPGKIKMVALTKYDLLSPEFKCHPLDKLNELLKTVAIRNGYQIIGQYPKEIGLCIP